MAEIEDRVQATWRPVIIWAASAVTGSVIVAIMALTWAMVVTGQRQETVEATRRENQALHAQVDANTKQTECRARITNAAESLRAERDSIGWDALVNRAVVGPGALPTDEMRVKVARLVQLNALLKDATDLRVRSIAVCADNPDFMPPGG